jgi:hypothetical protein
MQTFKVFSFVTKDTPYENEIEGFVQSCKDVGIESVKVIKVENLGSWVKNVNWKPKVCLHMFDTYDNPLVYVDIDARFKKYPLFFEDEKLNSFDIGVHYKQGRELLSGTIYLSHTDTTRSVLLDWINEATSSPEEWDQRTLQKVLSKRADVKVQGLPAEYTRIFDLMREVKEPVIEHFQKSRTYKKLIY